MPRAEPITMHRHIPNASLERCAQRGWDAYESGADISDNPEATALGRMYWHNGWCDARDSMPNAGGME
jgi:ribosome modulation factor